MPNQKVVLVLEVSSEVLVGDLRPDVEVRLPLVGQRSCKTALTLVLQIRWRWSVLPATGSDELLSTLPHEVDRLVCRLRSVLEQRLLAGHTQRLRHAHDAAEARMRAHHRLSTALPGVTRRTVNTSEMAPGASVGIAAVAANVGPTPSARDAEPEPMESCRSTHRRHRDGGGRQRGAVVLHPEVPVGRCPPPNV